MIDLEKALKRVEALKSLCDDKNNPFVGAAERAILRKEIADELFSISRSFSSMAREVAEQDLTAAFEDGKNPF